MKLKEIFDQLTYGELSQLAIGGGEQGQINEANYPSVVAHIRLALTALYKRFPLKENRLVLQLLPGVLQYEINSKYAVGNMKSLVPVKYILDSALPFKDDILKIERVYTGKGHELSLNDGADPFSLTTPSDQLGNRSPVLSDDDFLHGYPPAMRINVLSSSVCSQTRELAR